jgi:hypothetical protein
MYLKRFLPVGGIFPKVIHNHTYAEKGDESGDNPIIVMQVSD